MTRWIPELQPAVDAPPETWMEWLSRSFRKISNWSEGIEAQAPVEGYGGLYLETPIPTTFPLPTTPSFIGGGNYDTVLSSNPKGVVQNLAQGTLVMEEAGLWQLSAWAIGAIDRVQSNDSNTILLSLYNVTDAVTGDQPAYFTVPRYGETFNVGLSVPVRVEEDVLGKEFGLAIWQLTASPPITVTELTALDFHLTKIANADAL